MSIFLKPDDVAVLTGKKTISCQVSQLRSMGILFYINAAGRPVVPVSAVDARSDNQDVKKKEWQPNILRK